MTLHLSSEIERGLRRAISQDDVGRFAELAAPLKWGRPSWSVGVAPEAVLGHAAGEADKKGAPEPLRDRDA